MADREKQILYDFTYTWNLKKRNKTVINTENRLLPEGKGLGERKLREIKRDKFPVAK